MISASYRKYLGMNTLETRIHLVGLWRLDWGNLYSWGGAKFVVDKLVFIETSSLLEMYELSVSHRVAESRAGGSAPTS